MHAYPVPGPRDKLADRERLWKVASGKSIRWREMTILLLGGLQFFLGAVALLVLGVSPASILPLATGALFVALGIWQILNARIDAVWELVRSDRPT